jgi:hypothetical protein
MDDHGAMATDGVQGPGGTNPDRESEEWKAAHKRLTDRRDFGAHLVAYVVVNLFLVLIWAFTGAGYFWPAWVLGGWGIGLAMHAWDVFFRRDITDADVEREVRRRRG